MVLVLKNPPANAGDVRDKGLVPGSGRFPGGGNGNPLQYSCPENPMDRGAWWAIVCGVARSDMTEAAYHAFMHAKKDVETFIQAHLRIITWETVFQKALRTIAPNRS